ncbi:MAG: DUF1428 family protein [Silvanigrellales bacterium]|nr:DUF1428 family protein [Silvanigrellales bacterium]
MSYVDFFCLPVPTSKISEYTEVAKKYATIMKDYGLLSYCEALADDVKHGEVDSATSRLYFRHPSAVVQLKVT